MDKLKFITTLEFWKTVNTVSEWIFAVLDIFLITAMIWLFSKIAGFRQKLNIKETREINAKKNSVEVENVKSEKINLEDSYLKDTVKSKWQDIISKIETGLEKDLQMAIIDADSLLDLILKRKNYPGENLKERLNAIKQENLLNMDEVWQAHKTRNEIAHNPHFVIVKKDTEKILKFYKNAFQKLKVI